MCFVLPASVFTIGLSAVAPAAFALPELISEPNLPQSAKPSVADSPWDELVRKALDGDVSSATEIGKDVMRIAPTLRMTWPKPCGGSRGAPTSDPWKHVEN